MTIHVTCSCGAKCKAKTELAGRRVKCPSCGQPLTVPSGVDGSDADPLGLGTASGDPLGLGDAGSDAFDDTQMPVLGPVVGTLPSSSAAARSEPNTKRGRATTKAYDKAVILEVATGVLAIYHGGSAVYQAAISLPLTVKAAFTVGLGAFLSFGMLVFLISLAASGGILAGGIGVLMRRKWGLHIGAAAGGVYFVMLGIDFLIGLCGLISSGISGLGFEILVVTIPLVALNSLGPGLLVYLYMQRET